MSETEAVSVLVCDSNSVEVRVSVLVLPLFQSSHQLSRNPRHCRGNGGGEGEAVLGAAGAEGAGLP